MAILIDPPLWPAHGTMWSHLVSDASHAELHVFARGLGVPRRGFDLDHYDVPAHLHAPAIAAGAEPVTTRVLLVRLRAAGLRVRPVDRHLAARHQREDFLRAEWTTAGARVGAPDPPAWRALGEDLLRRWSEPHRRYHDLVHLQDVLLALDQLSDDVAPASGGPPASTPPTTIPSAVVLAAFFHDAVYDAVPGRDERRSAALAQRELTAAGLPAALAEDVARLVLTTAPASGADSRCDAVDDDAARPHDAALLRDADLAILAAGPKRYAAYAAAVRAEYAHVPEADFRRGRAAILQGFLDLPWIFATAAGRERWEVRARDNVAREVAELAGWPHVHNER